MFSVKNNTIQDNRAIKQIVLNTLLSEKDLLAAVYGHNKINGYTIETKKLTTRDNDYEISVRKNDYESTFIRFSFEMIEADKYEATIQIDMIEFQCQHTCSILDVFKFITNRFDHILKNVMVNNPKTVYSLPISYITVQDEEEVNLKKISLLDLLCRFKIDHIVPEINESKDTFSFVDLNNSRRTLLSITLNELGLEKTIEDSTPQKVIEYYFYPNQLKMAAEKLMLDSFCDICDRVWDDEEVVCLELNTFSDLEDFDIQIAIEESELYLLLQDDYALSTKREREYMQRTSDNLQDFIDRVKTNRVNT